MYSSTKHLVFQITTWILSIDQNSLHVTCWFSPVIIDVFISRRTTSKMKIQNATTSIEFNRPNNHQSFNIVSSSFVNKSHRSRSCSTSISARASKVIVSLVLRQCVLLGVSRIIAVPNSVQSRIFLHPCRFNAH